MTTSTPIKNISIHIRTGLFSGSFVFSFFAQHFYAIIPKHVDFMRNGDVFRLGKETIIPAKQSFQWTTLINISPFQTLLRKVF